MRTQSRRWIVLAAMVAGIAANVEAQGPVSGTSADPFAPSDSSGSAVMQWSYDLWSAPWVQIAGGARVLAPASGATLMALECESADLERDRLARHLSAAECEHRMAAIRAGQDTSLLFRLDLRVIDFPGASGLARLGPGASIWLEDDRGRRWSPIETLRGPVVGLIRGERLRRLYDYYTPPWVRDTRSGDPPRYRYEPYGGRPITIAEHRARFARRARLSLDPVVTSATGWLRLHLKYGSNEWVATWTFRPDSEDLNHGAMNHD
jgi:hypothetical protein